MVFLCKIYLKKSHRYFFFRNPTPEAFILMDNAVWPQFKTNDPYYLDINETLTVVKGIYYADRMAFWENLFPL